MRIPSEAEILEGLRAWVEIETPTDHPEGVNRLMGLVAEAYTELGARVVRIPGRAGAGDHLEIDLPHPRAGETGVLVLSHLDTVHAVGTLGQLPFRVEGDRAFGPGICDMKGGAYICYRALRTLIEAEVETPLPVRLVINSDEETGSETSRDLIERAAERAKYVLVTEPARSGGKIVTGRRGVGRYGISTHGRAAHAGTNHDKGRNAVLEMARQVIAIEGMTDYARGLTLNVGRIQGGTTDNTVPEWCHARIDVRMETEEIAEEIDARLRALAPHDGDVEVTLTGGINRPPYRKTAGIEALFQHARGLAAEIGFALEDMHTGGGSDGSFVAARVPTLDGLGVDGAAAHTLEEHLYVSSLVPRMTLQRRLFETLA
ncbi:MAG: M20 family metallopeptidase [Paracoccaceae bacterium]